MVTSKKQFKETQQKEVDDNYEAFTEMLTNNQIPAEKYGFYALMKGKKIVGYYDTWRDAEQAGVLAYEDKVFSIQEIVEQNGLDVGFYSYAILGATGFF